MRALTLSLLFALAACREKDPETPVDLDGDGVASSDDCDDLDNTVFPDAPERCDGLDNDCDLEVDEEATDAATWYPDVDRDGHGGDGATATACAAPEGYVADDRDCDDTRDDIFPGASEADCSDPTDYNCDGSVGYADADADGHPACQDCDDASAARFPGNLEICDDLDNDCDSTVDEEATDAATFFADYDGDGFGNAAVTAAACEVPEGYTDQAGDCDDLAASAYPGAQEVCDHRDNDCEGSADIGATDAQRWFADADGDFFGDPTTALDACEAPLGYVLDDADCNDAHGDAHPGAREVCDGYDNDCDGDADSDAADRVRVYADADADGYGDPSAALDTCDPPEGSVSVARDCDDQSAARHPGLDETCDSLDNDCDGLVDDNASDATTYYLDGDGDSYGGGAALRSCEVPSNSAPRGGDCDDAATAVFPGNPETCDSLDNDCDGVVDDQAADAAIWYTDADGDGFGVNGTGALACGTPAAASRLGGDCDDASSARFPGYPERCDSLDNDCDGLVDDDPSDDSLWFRDLDLDGFAGDLVSTWSCSLPAVGSWYPAAEDCDDLSHAVSPAATEVCNSIDDNCDGATDEDAAIGAPLWSIDADRDGHGDAAATAPACALRAGLSASNDDCDDSRADVSPSATPACDEVDHDCDSIIDFDADGDAYADEACGGSDCDDSRVDTYPGAAQACDDSDHDCNGAVDFDSDGDGWADESCGGSDCDDSDTGFNPDIDDSACDDVDHDCDGLTPLGTSAACPAETCLDVRGASPAAASGVFWVDPPANASPLQAWCDLATDGGGYTMLKVNYGSAVPATTAESYCATRGMRLFIPRSQAHLRAAYAVSNNASIAPSAGNYLYMMGIYPNSNGATCTRLPLRSGSAGCAWHAGDNGTFWVADSSAITEPNGDNCTTCSMYYAFNSAGDITWYNDIASPGYTSSLFMCSTTDK